MKENFSKKGKTKKSKTISDLIMEYFKANPNKDLSHAPVVDWVTEQWLKDHDSPPRDLWRCVRKLHQEGKLIKVKKGVYRYEPQNIQEVELFNFSPNVKRAILEKDGYKCVICERDTRWG